MMRKGRQMSASEFNPVKIIILGVGNSGTKLLGTLVHNMLKSKSDYNYHYEPLYWQGINGEQGITLNRNAINEHNRFPLLPDASCKKWPWMDAFIDTLNGLAKFIRAGSRLRLFIDKDVKYIWITRELYSYLASMQKNFPRCLGNAGWHHRPGEYDDIQRLQEIFPEYELPDAEEDRVIAEAAWWRLHNNEIYQLIGSKNLLHVRYEDLCSRPVDMIKQLSVFLGLPADPKVLSKMITSPPARKVSLSPIQVRVIDELCGELNRELYPSLQA